MANDKNDQIRSKQGRKYFVFGYFKFKRSFIIIQMNLTVNPRRLYEGHKK